MKNEYNDFQILSPANMELMAKKYYSELKSLKNIKEENFKDCYYLNQAIILLKKVKQKMEQTQKTCSRKFYLQKSKIIKNIINQLNQIIDCYPQNNNSQMPSPTNYCALITQSLSDLSQAITLFIKESYTSSAENYNIHSHILTLLSQIPALASLIGECKYREF